MKDRVIHVCPECMSPYLESNVMATAKIGSTFNWELDYQFPEDLVQVIEQAGADVMCSNCDWIGTWDETTVVNNTALDGVQYDTGTVNAAPIPFVTAVSDQGPTMPEIELGMLLTFHDPNFLYNEEEMVVIGKTLTDCRFVQQASEGDVAITNGKLVLISMTPSDTDQFRDVVLTYHGPHLVRLYQQKQLTVASRQKKLSRDLQDTETPESSAEDPKVVFIP